VVYAAVGRVILMAQCVNTFLSGRSPFSHAIAARCRAARIERSHSAASSQRRMIVSIHGVTSSAVDMSCQYQPRARFDPSQFPATLLKCKVPL